MNASARYGAALSAKGATVDAMVREQVDIALRSLGRRLHTLARLADPPAELVVEGVLFSALLRRVVGHVAEAQGRTDDSPRDVARDLIDSYFAFALADGSPAPESSTDMVTDVVMDAVRALRTRLPGTLALPMNDARILRILFGSVAQALLLVEGGEDLTREKRREMAHALIDSLFADPTVPR